jgi:hypothetical protein
MAGIKFLFYSSIYIIEIFFKNFIRKIQTGYTTIGDSMRKPQTYRSPWAALLWSAMLPGLGQLYNRDHWIGLLILLLELSLNFFSNLNYQIILEFNVHPHSELTHMNLHWLMFYPGIYSFSMWHAFNCAAAQNQELQLQGTRPTHHLPRLTGLFIGLSIGLLFGIIWPYKQFPILSGLGYGCIAMAVGHALDLFLHSKQSV